MEYQWEFTAPQAMAGLRFFTTTPISPCVVQRVAFYYSDDGLDWTVALSLSDVLLGQSAYNEFEWSNVGSHTHWKIVFEDDDIDVEYFDVMSPLANDGWFQPAFWEEQSLPVARFTGDSFARLRYFD